jgi:O-antigen/teichoic acid export membrane protein
MRFLESLRWSWLGLAVSFLTGVVFTPILLRHLGVPAYGLRALVFSAMEFDWLLEFGMRPARRV